MGSGIFVYKRLVQSRLVLGLTTVFNQNGYGLCFNLKPLMLLDTKWLSTKTEQKASVLVPYLMNTFGFSNKSALAASKYVKSISSEKVESLVSFFMSIGLSKAQVCSIIRRYPMLVSFSEKTLRPKIEFFYSKGMSRANLVKVLAKDPSMLGRSLKQQIMPCFDYLMSVLCSVDKVNIAISHAPDILRCDPESVIEPNLAILRECGVPEKNIRRLLYQQPRSIYWSRDRFKIALDEVKEMGISPMETNFVFVVQVKKLVNISDWETKKKIFKKWNWSDEEFMYALLRNPWFMVHSEDKINAMMDVFINKMGFEKMHIVRRPLLLSLSFKKRIVPRFLVFRVLSLKGLIDRSFSLSVFFEITEKLFLQRYVMSFEKEVPHLLKLYTELLVDPRCSGFTMDWDNIDLEVAVKNPSTCTS